MKQTLFMLKNTKIANVFGQAAVTIKWCTTTQMSTYNTISLFESQNLFLDNLRGSFSKGQGVPRDSCT
jgi:hypothetical protein